MRKCALIIGFIILCSFGSLANGVDDAGEVNDPRVNARANACYAGGTMAGQCEDDTAWEAGWYVIRHLYGMITAADVPTQHWPLLNLAGGSDTSMCMLIMSHVSLTDVAPPFLVTYTGPLYGDFTPGYVVTAIYSTADCGNPLSYPVFARWVNEQDKVSAIEKCAMYFGVLYTPGYGDATLVMPGIYRCEAGM